MFHYMVVTILEVKIKFCSNRNGVEILVSICFPKMVLVQFLSAENNYINNG